MSATRTNLPVTLPDAKPPLDAVLAAWDDATLRWEQTHEALRAEVASLTAELAAKDRELAHKTRLADLGQMAAHIAHEVRNHLVPVSLYMSLLRRRIAADTASLDVFEKIERGFEALRSTVTDLLNFAAERDPQLGPVPLRSLVEDVQSELAPQLAAHSIRTALEVPDELAVAADRDMLRRAVLNISLNALDAMPDGGVLQVAARSTADDIELVIADSGPGMSEEVRRRVFEPFFSTKSTGTGLGLAIVHRTAQAHGGAVTVDNGPQGGAVFTLRLPRRSQEGLR